MSEQLLCVMDETDAPYENYERQKMMIGFF